MNRSYRVVWNVVTMTWQAVAEIARGHGKSKTVKKAADACLAGALLVAGAQAFAAGALPTGGNVVAGGHDEGAQAQFAVRHGDFLG